MHQKNKKNKAFTLTELLVVVIVLGVLAAVSVPRFSRVLETRKTTEAENILTAVRTEQENRCVFGKKYLSDSSQLSMLSGVNDPNYTYSLGTQGITATSKSKGYQLKMLSYKDGQICCEGAYCDSLNKDYDKCSLLSVEVDECAADTSEEEPEKWYECSGSALTGQVCSSCGGTRTRTAVCNHSTGNWEYGEWSACSRPESECPTNKCDEAEKPDTSQECNGCGTQTRIVTCISGRWIATNWGECSKTVEECTDCPEGKIPNENGECVCEMTEEECVTGLVCEDGTPLERWDEETCTCEMGCPDPEEEEPEGGPYYWRAKRVGNGTRCITANSHSSAAAAREACEKKGDLSASYCTATGGFGPGGYTGVTIEWYCTTENIPCNNSYGFNPCTGWTGVGG